MQGTHSPSAACPGGTDPATAVGPLNHGQRIVTTARINDRVDVALLIDTGADRTVISPRALIAAGVSLSRDATSSGCAV